MKDARWCRKNEVVQKTIHDELVKKVNAIQTTDTSDLVKNDEYDTKIDGIEQEITDHAHSNKYVTTKGFNKLPTENFAAN